MTDKEIIQGLISRDDTITREFFFDKCRPLIISIIKYVFPYPVEYDELVNELYCYLQDNDSIKLKEFQFRSSLYMWLKVVAIRFFIRKRDHVIDFPKQLPHFYKMSIEHECFTYEDIINTKMDVENLLHSLRNERYVYVIQKLILEDVQPELLAKSMGITLDNLYNVKRRAIVALSKVAIKERNFGGKKHENYRRADGRVS